MTESHDMKSNKTIIVSVRLSPEEKKLVNDLAESVSVSPATFMRNAALNIKVTSKVDLETLRQIRMSRDNFVRVGNLMKLLITNKEKTEGIESKIEALIDELSQAKSEVMEHCVQVIKELQK